MSFRISSPRESTPLLGLSFFLVLLAGCTGQAPEQVAETPVPPAGKATPRAAMPTKEYAGSAACVECHADEVARHSSSGHRLSTRTLGDTERPFTASLGPDAEVLSHASPPSFTVADADGQAAKRLVSHVIGGKRREDFLTQTGDGTQVLPTSWSVTDGEFVEPMARDLGSPPEAGSPYFWTAKNRNYDKSCARCHGDVERNGQREADDHGISCEDCHGPGAEHVASARRAKAAGEPLASTKILRSSPDAWTGCAHCHAVGTTLPKAASRKASAADPFDAHLLIAAAHGAQGPNRAFYLDGRPASAHGYEVQALAQSACFRVGEINCISCHDPHGGLKGEGSERLDPDASCKTCHSELAADPAAHAGHPVTQAAIPLANVEPAGPATRRLPGCVDCHMPAIAQFGENDKARTHSIGIPEPELARDLATANACLDCHRGELTADELIASLEKVNPDRRIPRHARAVTFVAAALLIRSQEATPEDILAAVSNLTELVADTSLDDWTRASAASLLAQFGNNAEGSSSALLDAAAGDDLVLARAALHTLGIVETSKVDELAAIGSKSDDWRIRIVAASALAHLEDERGLTEFAAIMEDDALPLEARVASQFEMGTALLKQGAFKRAQYFFAEVTRLDPENTGAWLTIGALKAGQQDDDGARLAWQTVLELSPGNPQALTNLKKLEESRAGN